MRTGRAANRFAPMLAQTGAKPFSRPDWFFELKYDGVRAVITVTDGSVTIAGRRGRDETSRYPEALALGSRFPNTTMVFDAEIVALDDLGRPSFAALQPRIGAERERDVARMAQTRPVTIALFDLLCDGGQDITQLPLRQRKQRLAAVIADAPEHVIYVDHVETEGEAFFAALNQRGLEGMVAKNAASPYQAGSRSTDWIKVKAWRSQTCVVVGFTRGKGSRTALGALVVAVRDGRSWRHAGSVGSGFSNAQITTLLAQLTPLIRETAPLMNPPRDPEITWVMPELYCEVRHAGFTDSGVLRHPTLIGMRSDVAPADCTRVDTPAGSVAAAPARPRAIPRPRVASAAAVTHADGGDAVEAIKRLRGLAADIVIDGRSVHLTNLEKEMWPGIGKRELVAHYVAMAPFLLPHLKDRAVSAQVFPDGINGKSFWRKQLPSHTPEWVRRWTYTGERKSVTYAVPDSAATLAWLANSGAIDIHPWHSRIDAPQQPDWAVFDLDPSDGATFEDVRVIAKLIKVALDHLGLHGCLKNSGQTGLQIYVPILRGPNFSAVLGWVEEVSRAVGRVVPHLVTWEWTVSRRGGKVRIDYTQNVLNKTLAAPYAVRPMPGAPVSTPLTWDELEDPDLRPDGWTIATIGTRLASLGDLFAPVLRNDQKLPSPGKVTMGTTE